MSIYYQLPGIRKQKTSCMRGWSRRLEGRERGEGVGGGLKSHFGSHLVTTSLRLYPFEEHTISPSFLQLVYNLNRSFKDYNNNDRNACISRAPFHVRHAQLH